MTQPPSNLADEHRPPAQGRRRAAAMAPGRRIDLAQ
jgi:hypothetical protein